MHNYVEKSDTYVTWQECTTCGHRTENVSNQIDTETPPTSDTNEPDTPKPNETESNDTNKKDDDGDRLASGDSSSLGLSTLSILALILLAGAFILKKK